MVDTPELTFVDRFGDALTPTKWARMIIDYGVGVRLAESTIPSPLGDIIVRTVWTGIDDQTTGGAGLGPFVTLRAPLGRFYTALESYRSDVQARAGHTMWVTRVSNVLQDNR
jgi:hypothetical protein